MWYETPSKAGKLDGAFIDKREKAMILASSLESFLSAKSDPELFPRVYSRSRHASMAHVHVSCDLKFHLPQISLFDWTVYWAVTGA